MFKAIFIAMWRVYPKSYTISLLLMLPVTLVVYGEVWAHYGFLVMLGVCFVLSLVGGVLSRVLMGDPTPYALAMIEELGRLERKARS